MKKYIIIFTAVLIAICSSASAELEVARDGDARLIVTTTTPSTPDSSSGISLGETDSDGNYTEKSSITINATYNDLYYNAGGESDIGTHFFDDMLSPEKFKLTPHDRGNCTANNNGEIVLHTDNKVYICINPGSWEEYQGPQGADGIDGVDGVDGTGIDGINCWDLNGNGIDDPDENTNGDSEFNVLDCAGPNGIDGIDGINGDAGYHCWDLNENYLCDTDEQGDDSECTVQDCIGPQGEDGGDGINGADGIDGIDGTNGTDGTNGSNGTNGSDGSNGTNGTNGTTGTNGFHCWDLNQNHACDSDEQGDDSACTVEDDCIGSGSSADSLFQVNATDGSSIFYNGGRVGIGTSAPSEYLGVVGGIRADAGITSNMVKNSKFSTDDFWNNDGAWDREPVTLDNGDIVDAARIYTDDNIMVISAGVIIDPYKTYKFSIWIKSDNSDAGTRYFGFYPYTSGGTRANAYYPDGTPSTNVYFWHGDIPANTWKKVTGYIFPADTPDGWSKPNEATNKSYRMDPATRYVKLRFLNFYNDGTYTTNWFALPSIEEVEESVAAFSHGYSDYIINPTESVGIGTTSPSTDVKLDVKGTIQIDDGTAAADYILKSTDADGTAEWVAPGEIMGDTDQQSLHALPSVFGAELNIDRGGSVIFESGDNISLSLIGSTRIKINASYEATVNDQTLAEVLAKGDNAGGVLEIRNVNGISVGTSSSLHPDTQAGYFNGKVEVTDHLIAEKGVHIGGTSEPGVDDLIVDGEVDIGENLNVAENLDVAGNLDVSGGAVFNEDSADRDFRIESNNNANTFRVDAGNDSIGIGTSAPNQTLSVKGSNNINPHFPDGLDGDAKNIKLSSTSTYTVPSGKTLYISYLRATNTGAALKINNAAYFWFGTSASRNVSLANPIAISEGRVLNASSGTMYLSGIEVDANTTIKYFRCNNGNNNCSYTVPAGKTLYILSASLNVPSTQISIAIDNEIAYIFNSSDQLQKPLAIPSGTVFSATGEDSTQTAALTAYQR